MRWKSLAAGLAFLLAITSGCKQRCFLTSEDYLHCQDQVLENLETKPEITALPTQEPVNKPSTILDPDREIRYISLAEAISIALEQGRVGIQNFGNIRLLGGGAGAGGGISAFNTFNDLFPSFQGGAGNTSVGTSDAIRVLALDPAIVSAEIEASLSKFDAQWATSATWRRTDRPVGSPLDTFQSGAGTNAITQDDANVTTGIFKPLPTGGITGITFTTDYQFTNLPARVNPSYRPALQFQYEQPLLQGYGVEINQLRSQHPGAVQNLVGGAASQINQTGVPGILVARIRFDQQRTEFERNVGIMVGNVELAYWQLYYAYWALYAAEQGLRQSYETWRIANARFEAGKVALADREQARGQYESFRATRLVALHDLLDYERQLRGLLNLRVEDGTRLVPSDSPTLAPYRPDWDSALHEAMTLRPELVLARKEVKTQQLNLVLQKNFLLPDLRFFASYDVNAIGTRLDGPEVDNAFRNLSSNHFNNWTLGLRLNVPIGFRAAHANVRRAQLQLARSYRVLQDAEYRVESFLALSYRRLFVAYESIKAQRAAREAFAEQLRARFYEFEAGRAGVTIDILLRSQQDWAQALAQEYQAIRDYNQSLVAWEWAKGTLLHHNNVVISEGALPECVQQRAVEHLEERSKALQLRERPLPPAPLTETPPPVALEGGPITPETVPTLPKLLGKLHLLEDAPKLSPGSSPAQATGARGTPVTPGPVLITPVSARGGTSFGTQDYPAQVPGAAEVPSPLPSEFGTGRNAAEPWMEELHTRPVPGPTSPVGAGPSAP